MPRSLPLFGCGFQRASGGGHLWKSAETNRAGDWLLEPRQIKPIVLSKTCSFVLLPILALELFFS